MVSPSQAAALLCLLLGPVAADKEFWWMGQQGSFGQGAQVQPEYTAPASQQGSQALAPPPPPPLPPAPRDPLPITECPVGTACASETACAGQWAGTKEKDSALIPCMVPATAMLGVCCPSPPDRGVGNALPISQGLQQAAAQGVQASTCPASPPGLLPLSECEGSVSDCWSVGQPDTDCRDNALCCFDGCANVCQGAGSVSPARPALPARPVAAAPPRQPQQTRQPRPQRPKAKPQPLPQRPKPQARPQRPKPQPRPVQQTAKDPWPQTASQAASQPRRPVVPAEQTPFTQCPSAMKCVPRPNCDLKGVMTTEPQTYGPELDLLRVPLIPCVNTERGNMVDVCCRDPNYQDPWPGGMMMAPASQQGRPAAGRPQQRPKVQARPAKVQARPQKQASKKRPHVGKKPVHSSGKGSGGGGQGSCTSAADCPAGTPVCSEYGFCQCAAYRPGGPECWRMGGRW